jgi:hypothetical protein
MTDYTIRPGDRILMTEDEEFPSLYKVLSYEKIHRHLFPPKPMKSENLIHIIS